MSKTIIFRKMRSPQLQLRTASTRAMTLVEVVISLVIFGIVAASLAAAILQQLRSAEEAIYRNTALTMAQGYIEQLRGLPLNSFIAASSNSQSLALRNAAGTLITDEGGGTLMNGEWASETVFLDVNTDSTPKQPLRFRFRPQLVDLRGISTDDAAGTEITLSYQVTYNFGTQKTFSGALRTVRSHVPTY